MGTETRKSDLYAKISKVPSCIQIFGAPNSTRSAESPKLDEIDANAHETFTLEEMRVLILNYRKKNKDFIIARVTTADPENQTLFYNFYYAAPEINRILFRYEPSRRLLHRMKVKNPLNNMYIIGQVFYYKITIREIDRAIVNYFYNVSEEKLKSRKAFSAIFRKKHDFTKNEKKKKSKDSMDLEDKIQMNHVIEGKSPHEIIDQIIKEEIELPRVLNPDRKVYYAAKYFASDDDFLLKQDIRDYFKRNAIDPTDDFLYELDRTQNDFMALLDEDSAEEEDDVSDWRRVLSAHISLALSMLFICLIMGGGAGIAFLLLPVAIIIFLSFLSSLCYVLCCRRGSFDTVAVNSIQDEI